MIGYLFGSFFKGNIETLVDVPASNLVNIGAKIETDVIEFSSAVYLIGTGLKYDVINRIVLLFNADWAIATLKQSKKEDNTQPFSSITYTIGVGFTF